MATNTYTALATQTLGTAASSVTFSSIPAIYTDLVIVIAGTSSTSAEIYCQFNGDTGSNYSRTFIYGDGASAVSGRNSSGTAFSVGFRGTNQAVARVNIMNYANTTTYKTVLARSDASDIVTVAEAALWRSTAAINSINLYSGSGTFSVGSTFTIYGISAQPVATAKATGGTITYAADGYIYHTFTSNGTFTPTSNLTADVLCVAGGAAGGNSYGGGGGAGGVIYFASQSLTSGTGSTVVIGGGGSGTAGGTNRGSNGNNSTFASLTAAVGGGGGGSESTSSTGANGGSGGGGSRTVYGGGSSTQTGTGATAYYGNAGGGVGSSNTCAGGGGAGAAGTAGPGTVGGNGGNGTSDFSSWGLATTTGQNVSGTVYYAGGGAGNGTGGAGAAGYGGGSGTYAVAASANTGGGGMDGNSSGGSGIVIVRYLG